MAMNLARFQLFVLSLGLLSFTWQFARILRVSPQFSLAPSMFPFNPAIGSEAERSLVDRMAAEIQQNYFSKMAKELASNDLSIVTSTCRLPVNLTCYDAFVPAAQINPDGSCATLNFTCNGLGDRLRGTFIALSLAMATQRLFRFDWPRPSDISEFFDVEAALYPSVDPVRYQQVVNRALGGQSRWLLHHWSASNAKYQAMMLNENFAAENEAYSVLLVMSHRNTGLDSIFQNPSFRPILKRIVPSFFTLEKLDYRLIMSAMMRVLFDKPKTRLRALEREIIDKSVGYKFWTTSTRIGVQVRTYST